ncbi:transcription termination factor MTERF5, chloroplastic-like isoform X2 [Mangifera indica]|uniref:transcription termination factor MTERF5, chloroplastic-like isoform X2 n=1 Tax=Mangifera indica TaxID=29780 RepID=UPI001CFBD19F|nr:transcription termination factor MTERF5, chloroplastic-like isoform X2 [Mangifera indica]
MLMEMKTCCASRLSGVSSLPRGTFCITRTQLTFPVKLFFCQATLAFSSGNGSFNSTVVPPILLAAEKEEAKSVLSLFLKKQGLSKVVVAKTIAKSDVFINHLVSRIHSVHKSRYLVGRELTTFEIRDTLVPYIESLLLEHGNNLVNVVESFPSTPVKEKPATPLSQHHSTPNSKKLKRVSNAPAKEKPALSVSRSLSAPLDSKKPKVVSSGHGKEKPAMSVSQSGSVLDSKKLKTISQMIEDGAVGDLPPQFLYLLELGMDLEQIKVIIRRYPAFAYCSLEGKIKPLVEFLLDLGVTKSNIPKILIQRPSLTSVSLTKNLIPTMMFLEDLGVDKDQWAKVIYRFPGLLVHSRQKFQAIVDFLYESGLSSESIGKILTRWPKIVDYSVEENLQPTVEYFRTLGVDVAMLLRKSPLTLGHSIEGNLKPVTEFFLSKGYSVDEVRIMISRYAALYTCSLTENLKPKWEFFLTMGYSKSELVKFPQYFSYSLEQRIRPRDVLVKESGVTMLPAQMLSLSDCDFDKVLKMKVLKMANKA